VLELARSLKVKHLLMASTSSVYGANKEMPFNELQKCDSQISLYAATKKSTEVMAHSYSHLYNIPVTMFRFFTVYGPWGRPDMALFKFTKAIIEDEAIDIYNKGEMTRDFTYVEDLVLSIKNLIGVVPNLEVGKLSDIDSLSPVAPWRVVNIGNSDSVPLMEYVKALEAVLGKSAHKRYLGMQAGDVQNTLSDVKLLQLLTGSTPNTPIKAGVRKFVDWYLDYYDVSK
jgi:UDP-glucuronate 4-epimerase